MTILLYSISVINDYSILYVYKYLFHRTNLIRTILVTTFNLRRKSFKTESIYVSQRRKEKAHELSLSLLIYRLL